MKISSSILILLVAILHIYFLVLEMFLWNHPIGYKTFATTPEFAADSATLAMNQGLYNGFEYSVYPGSTRSVGFDPCFTG